MNGFESPYKRRCFSPEINQHAVRLYHRINLSAHDIEDLLAERGIPVTDESIRQLIPQYDQPEPERRQAMTWAQAALNRLVAGGHAQPG